MGDKSLGMGLVFSCGKRHAILSRIDPSLYGIKHNNFFPLMNLTLRVRTGYIQKSLCCNYICTLEHVL